MSSLESVVRMSGGSFLRLAVVLSLLLLAACGRVGMDDLQTYVAEVRARPGRGIDPLPELKPYEAFVYQAFDKRSPFSSEAVQLGETGDASVVAKGNGVRPDFERVKEPTEEFPLDSMRLVGSWEMGGRLWALVKDAEGTVHRLSPGNYVGQNHGRITKISEDRIELTEIVPDGLGGWIERQASLALSD